VSKHGPTLPIKGRLYGVEAKQQCNEKLPTTKTMALTLIRMTKDEKVLAIFKGLLL
jgi:hypothetical protein